LVVTSFFLIADAQPSQKTRSRFHEAISTCNSTHSDCASLLPLIVAVLMFRSEPL
jgi:hypothetical protein